MDYYNTNTIPCRSTNTGAATTLRPTVLPVFEQLGMMEELKSFSVELETAQVRNEKMRAIGNIGMKNQKEM